MDGFTDLWHTYRLYLVAVVVVLILWSRARSSDPTPSSTFVRAALPDADKNNITPSAVTFQEDIGKSSRKTPVRASGPKRISGRKERTSRKRSPAFQNESATKIQTLVFYSTLTGATEKYAKDLVNHLNNPESFLQDAAKCLPAKLLDLSEVELDDYFTSAPSSANTLYFYMILLPSYDIDTNLANFLEHLKEVHYDFRIDTAPLSKLLGYSVFGFGDRLGWPTESEGFCFQAKEADKWLAKLTGRKRAFPLGMGDVKDDAVARLAEWRDGVMSVLRDFEVSGSLGEGVPGSGDAVESDDEDVDQLDETGNPSTRVRRQKETSITDVEALGASMTSYDDTNPSKEPLAIDFTTYKSTSDQILKSNKEMVPKSSPTYAALTKQGYTIVGSHSGVKICRWTKSALRGRGSCYKFSFYGIKSHLCMETTPSLSCSNKCVFCWRHGTNPVGTTWRWQVDPPEMIFAGVKEGHYRKIKMMRGVPGVRAERFAEAMRIRHCALSLVGEPIFYPHINEFTALLHAERISSFLVCNAQHPAQLATLQPVTQLYVSIDASDRESLRRVDRPLHRDFWERFNACLDILREKRFRQRTVYRLTLVKGFNIDAEAEGYAALVEKGLPCFVEVKGVTYCGTSSSAGAGLTMQNVPFYEEVCAFVLALEAALKRRGLDYGIAAEHAHSCCILLASSSRFLIDGRWQTQINYDRFFELLESGKPFGPEDYVAPTPDWALWGNGGFDPADTKVDRKGRPKEIGNVTSA